MDKLINTHIDKVEDLEVQIERIIDQEMSQISIDDVLASPKEALAQVANNIRDIFLGEYAHDAIELGIQFGKQVKKKIDADKTIQIENVNDTNNG